MSKTIRRKNESYWNTKDEYEKYKRDDRSYKAALAYFHSDSEDTMQQVPKWYKVQFCRRPFRRKETVALLKEMKSSYEGEVPFPVIKKDAMYYW